MFRDWRFLFVFHSAVIAVAARYSFFRWFVARFPRWQMRNTAEYSARHRLNEQITVLVVNSRQANICKYRPNWLTVRESIGSIKCYNGELICLRNHFANYSKCCIIFQCLNGFRCTTITTLEIIIQSLILSTSIEIQAHFFSSVGCCVSYVHCACMKCALIASFLFLYVHLFPLIYNQLEKFKSNTDVAIRSWREFDWVWMFYYPI